MKQTDLSRLAKEDIISIIGKEWMLITAGDIQHFNTMTASWGGVGFLWGKPVAFVFIRPERYTHDFVEQYDRLTLTFFDEADKAARGLRALGFGEGDQIPIFLKLVPEFDVILTAESKGIPLLHIETDFTPGDEGQIGALAQAVQTLSDELSGYAKKDEISLVSAVS